MAEALSVDLRQRVVDAVHAGSSCRAAARFGVGVSSAIRWVAPCAHPEPTRAAGAIYTPSLEPVWLTGGIFRDYAGYNGIESLRDKGL